MQLTFLGATETVTGSKYLLEFNNKKILIDCGLFQGLKELRLRNWDKLPISPKNIDYVILTHAHIDHSGYIPLLIKNGFKGKIYCSEATYKLCCILLPDSGYLQEEDARRANKYGYTKHSPALALYTEKDALESLKYFQSVDFGKPIYFADDFHFSLSRSGHILGSSFISIYYGNKTIIFSGDLGRMHDPIMKTPAKLDNCDYLVIESTYGDRLHTENSPEKEMAEVINSTAKKGGSIIIPAFAVGRAQIILYYLYQLKQSKSIPDIPIFLDSPMAINATSLLCNFKNEHQLNEGLCQDICAVAKYIKTVDESKSLDNYNVPIIIISASGMATGGRVLHHLKHFMVDQKNTILFSGYQAIGTRGDRMMRGEKLIKIHGEMYPVNARIENITGLSAHADYSEILQWLSNFHNAPKKIFITHGEKDAALAVKTKIAEIFNKSEIIIPKYLQKETI